MQICDVVVAVTIVITHAPYSLKRDMINVSRERRTKCEQENPD